eukprot:Em0100g9a
MQLPAVGSVPLASVLGLPTVPWNLRLAASGMRREYLAFVPMFKGSRDNKTIIERRNGSFKAGNTKRIYFLLILIDYHFWYTCVYDLAATGLYCFGSSLKSTRSGNEATSIKITVGDDDIIDDLVDIALERLKMSVAKDTVTVKFQGNVVNKAESLADYVVITSNQKPLELEWKVEDMPKEEAFAVHYLYNALRNMGQFLRKLPHG